MAKQKIASAWIENSAFNTLLCCPRVFLNSIWIGFPCIFVGKRQNSCNTRLHLLTITSNVIWQQINCWANSVGPLAFLSTSCSFKSLLVNRSINPSSSAWTSFWPKISESYYPLFPNQSHPSRFSFVPSLSYYLSPPGWEWAETQPVRVRPPGDHIGIKFFVKKNHFHQRHQQKIIKISQSELEQS